jgi:hypothetical protein
VCQQQQVRFYDVVLEAEHSFMQLSGENSISLSHTFDSATIASGAITANSIVSIWDHLAMLDKVRLPEK